MSVDLDLAPRASRTGASTAPTARRGGIASYPPVLRTNPYQRLLYGELADFGFGVVDNAQFRLGWLWRARRSVGFLHFHWPQSYWRHETRVAALAPTANAAKRALFRIRLAVARRLGYQVVWTIHQVYPHERAAGDRAGALALARAADVLICHDAATRRHALEELGQSAERIAIVAHGSYVGIYPHGRGRDETRRAHGIDADAFVFLLFGDLRGYKGLALLLQAFAAAELTDATLIVAGSDPRGTAGATLTAAAASDRRIRPLLGFVADDDVDDLFAAADAAVVARSDGGTSGSMILALSLGRPLIAARSAVHAELTAGEDVGWTFEPNDVESLARALEAAASAGIDERTSKSEGARRCAEHLCWPEIGERTARLFVEATEAHS
jgi:beta-1,4-mannosyltransferase